MGTCNHCGKSAGFFSSQHPECQERFEAGQKGIVGMMLAELEKDAPGDDLAGRIEGIAAESFIRGGDLEALILSGYDQAVDRFLEDRRLEAWEEQRLVLLADACAAHQVDLKKTPAYTRVVQAAVVRDVLLGHVPERCKFDGDLPVNIRKGERLIWVFLKSKYLEETKRGESGGGESGRGVRVGKGEYHEIGEFKGVAGEHPAFSHVDTGYTVITDKHVYFSGAVRSVRMSYGKIVSFRPFADGVGVMRDAASAKWQVFATGEGWFTYNLVRNLAKLA